MKNVIPGLFLLFTLITTGCSNREIKENQSRRTGGDFLSELKYKSILGGMFFSATIVRKSDNKRVAWFQFFDRVGDKKLRGYSNSKKVGRFPAKVFNNRFIWILVNNRFEIRLVADNVVPDYQDNEKLKKILMAFHLDKMEAYKGPKINSYDLKQFIPDIEGKEN